MHPMVLKNLLMVLTLSDLHSSILFHPANEDKLIPESIYDTTVFFFRHRSETMPEQRYALCT